VPGTRYLGPNLVIKNHSQTSLNLTEAFVYRWRHSDSREWYIGYHKGTADDGYICSSKIAHPRISTETGWTRRILRGGTKRQMLALEMRLLTRLNAKDNPKSLNKSNGYPPGTYYGSTIRVRLVRALPTAGVVVWPKFNQALKQQTGMDYYSHVSSHFFRAVLDNNIPLVKDYIPIIERVFGVVLDYDIAKKTK
jgi:hypothetical protein